MSTATPSTTQFGIQNLQRELLALVGVAAGLRGSLRLSTCCQMLREALASSTIEDQLFGRLFAIFAGVDDPYDAMTPSPPPATAPIGVDRPSRCSTYTSLSPQLAVPAESPPTNNAVPTATHPSCRCTDAPLYAGEWSPPTPSSAKYSKNRRLQQGCMQSDEGLGFVGASPPGDSSGSKSMHASKWSSPRPVPGQRECVRSWRMQLKWDLATAREPERQFTFLAQQIGRQDVLMAVVPSNPPILAVTCTTKLSLFSLDGKALPTVAQRGRSSDKYAMAGGGNCSDVTSGHFTDAVDSIAEPHERDIRCIAASPAGDMVATGSLDCTIRVRSVPGCDWVCRLRGHEAAVRCILFHRPKMLASGDGLGNLAIWSLHPVRRLQTVQAHRDSIQVLTTTGNRRDRLATGGLDGFVRVWSMADDGSIHPILACSGFCHPFNLAAIRGALVFTSASCDQSVKRYCPCPTSERRRPLIGRIDEDSFVVARDDRSGLEQVYVTDLNYYRYNTGLTTTAQSRSGLSVVNTEHGTGTRVVTGHMFGSNHLGPAGTYLGAVVASPIEPWAASSVGEMKEEDDDTGRTCLDSTPRVCCITTIKAGVDDDTRRVREISTAGNNETVKTSHGHHVSCWVDLSPSITVSSASSATRLPHHRFLAFSDRLGIRCLEIVCTENNCACSTAHPDMQSQYQSQPVYHGGIVLSFGVGSRNFSRSHLEDSGSGALCTCSLVVGATIFLGYDTGGVWAHNPSTGRRIYRLDVGGPIVHLLDAFGYLFAYASSGMVSRWTWRDRS